MRAFAHILLPLGLVAIFSIGAVIFLNSKSDRENPASTVQRAKNIIQPVPSASPIPFVEMTIPALRQRSYDSKLGQLNKISSNQVYASHIASFDSDGSSVNGLLTIPSGQAPVGGWPAIVFIHGFIPPDNYNTTQNYVSYVDYFARQGFVVYKIDLRGHGNSEGDALGGYFSDTYIVDTLNAVSALQKAEFVNPNSIGLWGHSMGGNVVFRSFVASQDIPAVVIWAGAVYTYADMQEYGISDNSYSPPKTGSKRQRIREEFNSTHGRYNPDSVFWQMVPATNYLEGVSGAVQIHHAKDDAVVNIDYSRNLVDILSATAISHELLEYTSGGHNMTGNSFNQAMQRSSEFFNKHLINTRENNL